MTAPETEAQREIWASAQMGDDVNCAHNESQSLRLLVQIQVLQAALQQIVMRLET